MNCKQGDLAIIVKSAAGNEGKIVRCIKYAGIYLHAPTGFKGHTWKVDRGLPSVVHGMCDIFHDEFLRPIRDNDCEDETLTWCNKPHKETA